MTPSKSENESKKLARTENSIDLQAAYLVLIRAYFRRLAAMEKMAQGPTDAKPPQPCCQAQNEPTSGE